MSNGKIIWIPPAFWALALDGAHYLSLASADFNPGTGDLTLDFLFYPDSTQADTEGLICGKGAANLANLAGWQIFADKTSKRLVLKINDGQATVLTVYSNNDSFVANTFSHGRVALDRDGLASFFVNNVVAGAGSIAARPGSLNNAEVFKVGGLDAATNRFKGYLGMLRVDQGRLLPAAWRADEWDRLRFGLLPRPWEDDFLATWLFGQSLTDTTGAYALTYNPETDAPVYVAGYPSAALSYEFQENFDLDFKFVSLDFSSQQRAASSLLRSCAAPGHKRRFEGKFQFVSYTQRCALEAAHKCGGPIDFYLNAERPRSMRALHPPDDPPDFSQVTVGAYPYSGDYVLEEI